MSNCADPLDRASQELELEIERGIQSARNNLKRGPELPPKGYCYNCDEPFEDRTQRFCDADCREDYYRLKENGKI